MYKTVQGRLEKNNTEAMPLLCLAADQGHVWAQKKLGLMYKEGRGGLEKNNTEAIQCSRG